MKVLNTVSLLMLVGRSCIRINGIFLDVFAPAYVKDKFGPVS